MLIYTKKFSNNDYIIKEIKVEKFPLVIITDTHTNIAHIERIRKLYKNHQIICLGDITFAFDKTTNRNSQSIQYFIHKQIPCLIGNHDEFVADCGDFETTIEEDSFIKKLPVGFKLILPDKSNYLCFHNAPLDLWGFQDKITEKECLEKYPIDSKTIGIIIGHHHYHFKKNFKVPLIGIGRLSKNADYALLDLSGIKFLTLL